MTSVARETDGRAQTDAAVIAVERAFVSVFGYARSLEADAAALWQRVDLAQSGCDAQIRI